MTQKEYSRAYYLANIEVIREKGRVYRQTHVEEIEVRRRKYYQQNKKKMNAYCRMNYRKNSKRLSEGIRKARLKREFGITGEIYDEMVRSQNNVCAICQQPETAMLKGKIKRMAVDHCHKTNKVRGLLCQGCNQAIGYVKDDVRILAKMIDYLKNL